MKGKIKRHYDIEKIYNIADNILENELNVLKHF